MGTWKAMLSWDFVQSAMKSHCRILMTYCYCIYWFVFVKLHEEKCLVNTAKVNESSVYAARSGIERRKWGLVTN